MRLDRDRVVRVLLIAAPALGLFCLLNGHVSWTDPWRLAGLPLFVLAGAVLVGLVARALRARGCVRTARGIGVGVLAGALALAAYAIEAWDWIDAVASVIAAAGPLAVAIGVARSTRDTAGFAVGATIAAAASWHFWPVPSLAVLGFALGRGSLGGTDTTARHALSQVGAGALAMLMVAAAGFDLVVLLHHTLRPDAMGWAAHLDGPGTHVPRLAGEGLVIAAALAHAQGRSWGVLALATSAPAVFVAAAMGPLPWMGGGCLYSPHPLYAIGAMACDGFNAPAFGLALAVAVVPWIGPFARAARSARGTRT